RGSAGSSPRGWPPPRASTAAAPTAGVERAASSLFLRRDVPAEATHVADRIGAQALAQAVDDDFHGVAAHFVAPAIDTLFKLLAGQHRSRTLQERVQQGELPGRQRQ